MTDSRLTEVIADCTRAHEDATSGVSRHMQWHTEQAERIQRELTADGYVIVPRAAIDSVLQRNLGIALTDAGRASNALANEISAVLYPTERGH